MVIAIKFKCPKCENEVSFPDDHCKNCKQPLNWNLDPAALANRDIKRLLSLLGIVFLMGVYLGITGQVIL